MGSHVVRGEDDIMSDEDSIDSTGVPGGFGDLINVQYSTSTSRRRESAVRPLRSRGSGRGRRGGAGRGGKGIPKGPRKAIEPTEEFKALLSQAIIAFIAQRYDEAEQSALQAVAINPEMYEAHNLLSQIHVAKGNFLKALSASFAGAHTRNRDPEVWSRTADLVLNSNGDDRDFYLDRALYCITRVINLDRQNVGARYQRALLRHELGHNGKAATEYEELLKQLPHDTTVLRHLAEVCIELEKPGRALEHYVSSIVHFRELEPDEVSKFTWSDVNIVTELYAFQERFEEGMMQLKSLSRWLLGRGKDTFWEAYDKDDREWDLEDQPRRIMVSDFESEKYDEQSYGCGLPLELRVKLGVFRLKAERRDLEEAIVGLPARSFQFKLG